VNGPVSGVAGCTAPAETGVGVDDAPTQAGAVAGDLSATTTAPQARRPVRSFVVRAGRMGPGQARALVELGPRFVLPFAAQPLDLAAVFGRHAPVVLEIGFGMGDATAQVAAAQPQTNFLGIEVHEPGVGALLRQIGERQLTNLRLLQHDAVEVLQQMIPPASLAGVHLWFPDPWHKKRHHKRRLVQPGFVNLVAARLAPGGYLHCATDWQPYAEQMREVLQAAPALLDTSADGSGCVPRPAWRPQTKFEARGLRLGHGVWDLVFRRASPPNPATP
jgi:tRNA (guanine-N7-)-methyltransferase